MEDRVDARKKQWESDIILSQNKRNRYTSSEDELYTGLSCYVAVFLRRMRGRGLLFWR